MKKQIAVLCTVLLWVCAVFAPMARAAGPALSATEAYCIIDADTGLVLAQQNMDEELHPASITKVMTLGLACEKAQGQWDGVSLEVTHEDVYSLAGTDSSHIALQEGEHVPLTDALYATMMASANDGANLLSEYFGDGTIAGGVAAMNAQVAELGLKHTHFANPHGISDTDHYTSCYDMAQILRWALTQPGFETLFTRNEMYFVIARYVSINGTPCVLEMVSRLNEGRWIDANGSRFLLDRTRGEDMQLFLDPLTGVYARRYFETYRTHLEGMEGVALIDVNSFKNINDTCGHAAGDAALRDIAGAIRSCIRKTDILIRYGGDEFLLLFPRMTEEIFLEKKKQIQQTVRGVRMSEFADIQLSVSVGGVCGVHPITEAIRKADYLMYLDKAEQQP